MMTESKKPVRITRRAHSIIPVMAALCLLAIPGACTRNNGDTTPPEFVTDISGYSGKLRVSLYDKPGNKDRLSALHRSAFLNNMGNHVMEDNDIRGFLDGNFIWGWNQPGQVHVRVGRRHKSAKYGEYELFRVTYRWEPLPFPENTVVRNSSVKIFIEESSKHPVDVYLYRINKDWNPGTGGVLNNNISPPKDGEMWWRDIGYNEMSWGLPGVNFASDTAASSDTPEMPLAATHYTPGDEYIEFSSAGLTDYLNERVATQSPILFLLKLSDHHEDIPGTTLTPYSGNTGDNRNTGNRPSLHLEWQAGGVTEDFEYDVDLEYSRDYTFPKIQATGQHLLAASFIDSSNPLPPELHYRTGKDGTTSGWNKITTPIGVDADWVQLRIRAAHDAVILGNSFTAELKDTWVLSAPPEEQPVPWYFISPSGNKYTAAAEYRGDYTWSVTFTPDELGPWKYYWQNNFSGNYQSDTGRFDVVIDNQKNSIRQLDLFRERLEKASLEERDTLEIHMHQFAKLERAAIRFLGPDTFNSDTGNEVRALLNDIRGVLANKPPDVIPLKANPRFKWQKKNH